MKFVKNAHKAWSTWGMAITSALLFFRDELMPTLEPVLSADTYMTVTTVIGIAALTARFIDQGLQDE